MKTSHKWIAAGLLGTGLVLFNYVASLVPGQADFTAGKIYTLSDGTKALLAKTEHPLAIKFYFSRSVEGLPVQVKNFADRVEGLLRQFARQGGGNITLEVIDPKPDTKEEDAATRAGLNQVPLRTGENVILGLVVTCADKQEVIPFLDPNPAREAFLEYDIAQLVHQVQQLKQPKLGILTSLSVFGSGGSPNPFQQQQQQEEEWVFVSELKRRFEVIRVEGDTLPENLDVLLVLHPGAVSETQAFNIDQFVLSGKPLLAAVDPSNFRQRNRMNPMMMMQMGGAMQTSSNLGLLEKYGIEVGSADVVADQANATALTMRRGQRPSAHPEIPTYAKFPSESPITTQLQQLMLIEPGRFSVKADSGLKLLPLVNSSAESQLVSSLELKDPKGVEKIVSNFKASGVSYTLAGLVTGKLKTAFPNGRPPAPKAEGENAPPPPPPPAGPVLTESKGDATILVMADADFFADDFSVQVQNIFGTRAIQPLNDNLSFFQNCVEFLAGSKDLIGVRGKGTGNREFTKVKDLEMAAQKQYQGKIEEIQAKLDSLAQEISKLQANQTDKKSLILSPETQKKVQEFKEQQIAARNEMREIRKKLREDVEALDRNLALLNVAAMPMLVGIFGIFYFVRRNNRRAS